MAPSGLQFFQLFEHESSTYSYVLMDRASKETVLIDPVLETFERDLQLLQELGAKLKFIFETHVHADHVTSASKFRSETGCQVCVGAGARISCADILLQDSQEIQFGSFKIKALATPGHTDGCTSYVCEGRVFTGDALLIRGCGRTDFQQGSSSILFESVHSRIFSLPDETLVYPAHDYKGQTCSSVGLEKKFNPRLGAGKTKDEFIKIMADLKLSPPKKIEVAVPANLLCGQG